jgi:hypothetical protein
MSSSPAWGEKIIVREGLRMVLLPVMIAAPPFGWLKGRTFFQISLVQE